MDYSRISSLKKNKKHWLKGRKSAGVKTNLNNHYFMRLIKKANDDYLSVHGDRIKRENPEVYYSMKNKPLPKKYKKLDILQTPVNAHLEYKIDDVPKVVKKVEEKKEIPTLKFTTLRKDPNRGMRWVNPNIPINQGKLGSSRIIRKKDKRYYY
tara:strand:+ start:5021 stop:5479 length:459 start_codon:yes stop_codon:yes gene_type:complete